MLGLRARRSSMPFPQLMLKKLPGGLARKCKDYIFKAFTPGSIKLHSGLCEGCRRAIFISRHGLSYPAWFYTKHCSSCSLLYSAWTSFTEDYGNIRPELRICNRFFRVYLKDHEKTILLVSREAQNPWGLLSSNNLLLHSTGSDATVDRALEWIRDCTKHRRCGYTGDRPLPTRILDIGNTTCDEVVLYEPVNQMGRYVCLSYCWGNSKFINTSSKNIQDHKKGIPWEVLPRTFQEAIDFTRRLGIRYIWIDALCIVQDDHADWEREAGKMANIYEYSFLTIAATCAESPEAGLFSNPSKYQEVELDAVRAQLINHFPNSPMRDTSNQFPLLGRSWTYQERMLAPRVLYFCKEELAWECSELRKCECNPRLSHFLDEVSKTQFSDALTKPDIDNYTSLEKTWRQIIVQYSPLTLTVPSDKLPALSGLAERMRSSTNQGYFAGLWWNSLALDLLWFRGSYRWDPDRPSITPEYVAQRTPSWSWASVDGQVTYEQGLYNPGRPKLRPKLFCKVLHAECNPSGQSATGQVLAGSIRIKSSICPASIRGGSLILDNEFLNFRSDRGDLEEENVYLVRIVRLSDRLEETLLVVRAVNMSSKIFKRAGLAWTDLQYAWPAEREITII
ncbi:HET domain containing protein [Hyaloscypha variabilis]